MFRLLGTPVNHENHADVRQGAAVFSSWEPLGVSDFLFHAWRNYMTVTPRVSGVVRPADTQCTGVSLGTHRQWVVVANQDTPRQVFRLDSEASSRGSCVDATTPPPVCLHPASVRRHALAATIGRPVYGAVLTG